MSPSREIRFSAVKNLSWLVLSLRALAPLRADIELRGILQREEGYLFSLGESTRTTPTKWVEIGGLFHGFVVEHYDVAHETVRLRKKETVIEARLLGPPAPTAPIELFASNVVTEKGSRLCAVHRTTLVKAQGFVAELTTCARPSFAMLATLEHRADFPNSFGWSVSRTPSPSRNIEVIREFCPTCERSFVTLFSAAQTEERACLPLSALMATHAGGAISHSKP